MRPTSRTTTNRAALLAAVVVALTLAACGDSDDVESRGRAQRGGGGEAAEETTTTTPAATTSSTGPAQPGSATATTGPAQPGSATSTTTTSPGARPTELTLVAKNIAFDRQLLQVPVAQEVIVTFDNQDEGIPHNLHIRGLPGGDVVTEIVSGPEKQEVELKVDRPGSYAFQCDVHPTEMVGNVEVA